MAVPELFIQSMIVKPTALRTKIDIAWNAQANHSVCTVRVTEGATDILLASSTGSLPTWREPEDLGPQLQQIIENVTHELYLLTRDSEPF